MQHLQTDPVIIAPYSPFHTPLTYQNQYKNLFIISIIDHNTIGKERQLIHDYPKATYLALCMLIKEPHRAEQLLIIDGWNYYYCDILQGIRKASLTDRGKGSDL